MPDRRVLRNAQVFLLVSLFHLPLQAQEPQSHQRGLTAGTAYQLGEIDTVNLFNGNVVLTLPIGLSLPIGPELSAGINLVYNSNGWAHDERTCNDSGEVEPYAVPILEWTSNAGFSWTVNFGRLFAPYQEPENEDNINWMFLAPDGSRRNFYTELHPGHPSTPQADTWFSRDGTYLRMKRIVPETSECASPIPAGATSGCYLVEYEGQIHEFRNFPTATQPDFRVVRMRDLFGNYVDVEYPSPNTWRLRDMHGRVQIIRFNGGKVQSIEVTQFGTFAKAIPPLPPDDLIPCYHTVTVKDPQGNDTVHYFASSRGRNNWAKGLPLTFCDPHNGSAEYANGPYLSQEIYEGVVASGNKVRSIWMEYDSNGREWNHPNDPPRRRFGQRADRHTGSVL